MVPVRRTPRAAHPPWPRHRALPELRAPARLRACRRRACVRACMRACTRARLCEWFSVCALSGRAFVRARAKVCIAACQLVCARARARHQDDRRSTQAGRRDAWRSRSCSHTRKPGRPNQLAAFNMQSTCNDVAGVRPSSGADVAGWAQLAQMWAGVRNHGADVAGVSPQSRRSLTLSPRGTSARRARRARRAALRMASHRPAQEDATRGEPQARRRCAKGAQSRPRAGCQAGRVGTRVLIRA